jgi:hypothetical protein
LEAAKKLEPTVRSLLHTMYVVEPKVSELPFPGIKQMIKEDLTTMSTVVKGFEEALKEKAPVSFLLFIFRLRIDCTDILLFYCKPGKFRRLY